MGLGRVEVILMTRQSDFSTDPHTCTGGGHPNSKLSVISDFLLIMLTQMCPRRIGVQILPTRAKPFEFGVPSRASRQEYLWWKHGHAGLS